MLQLSIRTLIQQSFFRYSSLVYRCESLKLFSTLTEFFCFTFYVFCFHFCSKYNEKCILTGMKICDTPSYQTFRIVVCVYLWRKAELENVNISLILKCIVKKHSIIINCYFIHFIIGAWKLKTNLLGRWYYLKYCWKTNLVQDTFYVLVEIWLMLQGETNFELLY